MIIEPMKLQAFIIRSLCVFEGIIMLDRNPPFQSGGDLRLSPTNLSDKYRKDQQKLKIKYKFTNSEVSCNSSPFGEIKTRRIKIITVKKI